MGQAVAANASNATGNGDEGTDTSNATAGGCTTDANCADTLKCDGGSCGPSDMGVPVVVQEFQNIRFAIRIESVSVERRLNCVLTVFLVRWVRFVSFLMVTNFQLKS